MTISGQQWYKLILATVGALGFLASAATAWASVTVMISITGTPTGGNPYGYDGLQSYTFNFTVNSAFVETAGSGFDSTMNYWSEETVSEIPLFTGVTGDNMTGSFVRPILGEGDPWSELETRTWSGQPELYLDLNNDATPQYPIGLQIGGVNVLYIEATARIGDIFPFPETYTNPAAYFSALAGTYAASSGQLMLYTENLDGVAFFINSVTISAVPEPATTALLTGMGMLALVLIFRRRGAR